jgi:hypothetical protein
MADYIFLYQGRPCEILRRPDQSHMLIRNPATGRRKTVLARDVVAAPYGEHDPQKLVDAPSVGSDKTDKNAPVGSDANPEVLAGRLDTIGNVAQFAKQSQGSHATCPSIQG